MPNNVLVLNNYGLTQRTRVNKSGTTKQRYTVTTTAEPMVCNLDPAALGKGVAVAIAELFRERITGISATAAPATIKARQVALRAVRAGKSWALKRYAGGKTGLTPPAQSDSLFNDSGRLARSIAVGANGDGWVVNVAANRLDPSTLDHGGTGALRMIFDRLREFVPELGDSAALMNALPVRAAMAAATKLMIVKVSSSASAAGLEVAIRLVELAGEAVDAADAA